MMCFASKSIKLTINMFHTVITADNLKTCNEMIHFNPKASWKVTLCKLPNFGSVGSELNGSSANKSPQAYIFSAFHTVLLHTE